MCHPVRISDIAAACTTLEVNRFIAVRTASQSLHILHRANIRTANFVLDSVTIIESPVTPFGSAFNAGKIIKVGEFEATLVVSRQIFRFQYI